MISLIVCHRNKIQLANFKSSADKTIKGEYEFVIIDNSQNKYNIFEAYNLGVKKAKGNYLVFCHEDILFHTESWEQLLINHFTADNKLGLIGVVGGTALPAVPAPWWNYHNANTHYINVIQHWKNLDNINKWEVNKRIGTSNKFHHSNNPTGNIINEVVAVDGFFMACPKSMFTEITFDEDTFKGFHCYDIDTCLQVINKGYNVAVVHDILIEHTSEGNVNKQWAEAAINCARKWKTNLPIIIEINKSVNIDDYNTDALLTFCYWIKGLFKDVEIRSIIKEFLPKHPFFPKTKNHLFLLLWKYLGYSFARYPYKLFKQLMND